MTTHPFRRGERLVNILATLILIALGASIAPAKAQESVSDVPASGNLLLRREPQAEPFAALRVSTRYVVSVTGTLARVQVEQSFTNPTDDWAEGLYVFPLPSRVAVDHLK